MTVKIITGKYTFIEQTNIKGTMSWYFVRNYCIRNYIKCSVKMFSINKGETHTISKL